MTTLDPSKPVPDSETEVAPAADGIPPEAPVTPADAAVPVKTVPTQWILIGLGTIAFLYYARPVVLPVFLAILAAMALKPLMRWLGFLRLSPGPAAAIVFVVLVTALVVGFVQLGRPAVKWIDDGPQH